MGLLRDDPPQEDKKKKRARGILGDASQFLHDPSPEAYISPFTKKKTHEMYASRLTEDSPKGPELGPDFPMRPGETFRSRATNIPEWIAGAMRDQFGKEVFALGNEFVEYNFISKPTKEQMKDILKWSADTNASYEEMPPGALGYELLMSMAPYLGGFQAGRDMTRDYVNGEVGFWTAIDGISIALPPLMMTRGFAKLLSKADKAGDIGKMWRRSLKLMEENPGKSLDEIDTMLQAEGLASDASRKIIQWQMDLPPADWDEVKRLNAEEVAERTGRTARVGPELRTDHSFARARKRDPERFGAYIEEITDPADVKNTNFITPDGKLWAMTQATMHEEAVDLAGVGQLSRVFDDGVIRVPRGATGAEIQRVAPTQAQKEALGRVAAATEWNFDIDLGENFEGFTFQNGEFDPKVLDREVVKRIGADELRPADDYRSIPETGPRPKQGQGAASYTSDKYGDEYSLTIAKNAPRDLPGARSAAKDLFNQGATRKEVEEILQLNFPTIAARDGLRLGAEDAGKILGKDKVYDYTRPERLDKLPASLAPDSDIEEVLHDLMGQGATREELVDVMEGAGFRPGITNGFLDRMPATKWIRKEGQTDLPNYQFLRMTRDQQRAHNALRAEHRLPSLDPVQIESMELARLNEPQAPQAAFDEYMASMERRAKGAYEDAKRGVFTVKRNQGIEEDMYDIVEGYYRANPTVDEKTLIADIEDMYNIPPDQAQKMNDWLVNAGPESLMDARSAANPAPPPVGSVWGRYRSQLKNGIAPGRNMSPEAKEAYRVASGGLDPDEYIISSAIRKTHDDTVHYGPLHSVIRDQNGVYLREGFYQGTGVLGFRTNKRPFITREEAGDLLWGRKGSGVSAISEDFVYGLDALADTRSIDPLGFNPAVRDEYWDRFGNDANGINKFGAPRRMTGGAKGPGAAAFNAAYLDPDIKVTPFDVALAEKHNAAYRASAAPWSDYEIGTTTRMGGGETGQYMVAPSKSTETILPEGAHAGENMTAYDIAVFRKVHGIEEGDARAVGTWFNPEADANVLDIAHGFDDKERAMRVAQDADQDGIFDAKAPEGERFIEVDKFENTSEGLAQRLQNRQWLDDHIPERREARRQKLLSNLSPSELARYEGLNDRDKLKAEQAFSYMPAADEAATYAKLGESMLGWYDDSGRAIVDVFGPEDGPRFSAFLAALSPNAGIEANTAGTLEFFHEWKKLPEELRGDKDAIEALVKEFAVPHGLSAESSVPNVTRVANATMDQLLDPKILAEGGLLSGLKVDAFYANQMHDVQRVTIDTHHSKLAVSKTGGQTVARNLGIAAATRHAGDEVSDLFKLGRKIEPAEIQETQWSLIKAWGDLTKGRDPEEWLFPGGKLDLDNWAKLQSQIHQTPSYATLLNEPENVARLERIGVKPPEARPRQVEPRIMAPEEVNMDHVRTLAQKLKLRREGKSLYQVAAPLAASGLGSMAARQQRGLLAPNDEEPPQQPGLLQGLFGAQPTPFFGGPPRA
jgi:hypothetical protein